MKVLENRWYLAAWNDELGPGSHLVRTIAEKALLLLRDEHGGVAALSNLCPHRFAPLSRGKIEPGRLTCGYHGIAFDYQGRCVANPHGPVVSALTVQSFPVAVRYKGIWVWLGEAEKADPALIVDLSIVEKLPPIAHNFGYELIEANHQLCTDNILDLSHADFLHPDSLGGGATTRAKRTLKEEGDEITITWFAENDVAPPALEALMDERDKFKPIDLYLSVRWSAPNVMRVEFGLTLTAHPQLGGPQTWGIHVMTPLDHKRTHYFFWSGRDRMWTEEANIVAREAMNNAFRNEDKPMLEAQQAMIGEADFETLRPALLRTDEASTRVRRKLRTMIDNQKAECQPART